MNLSQASRMMDRIKFLVNLDDDACVLIFTRADADTKCMVSEERGYGITDEEWDAIVRDFDKNFLGYDEWESFAMFVRENLDKTPTTE